MTISHHPTDETLLRHAAGHLPAGPALVVATHLSSCPACRSRLAAFEAVGGMMLEEIEPEAMAPDAFAALLHRLDRPEPPPPPAPAPGSGRLPHGIVLPEPLRDCEIGPWRWIGIGIRASTVTVPQNREARLTLLRVGPDRKLPEHGHTGTEFTQVLFGSFSDSFGRYGPGDLTEMGAEVEHQPVVDPEGECICLAALEGEMRLSGWLGRLIQPFIRL